jgi:hypothetical protein
MARKPKPGSPDLVGDDEAVRQAVGLETPAEPALDGKDPAAKALGRRGGKARAKKMTAERRTEIAKSAAMARWKKDG